jgi:hypothetical protein
MVHLSYIIKQKISGPVVGLLLEDIRQQKKLKLQQDNTQTKRKKIMAKKTANRYKVTIEKNGLGSYETEIVEYALGATSAKDALRRIEVVYERCEKARKRIPYNSKMFLEALAISAETDLYYVD